MKLGLRLKQGGRQERGRRVNASQRQGLPLGRGVCHVFHVEKYNENYLGRVLTTSTASQCFQHLLVAPSSP